MQNKNIGSLRLIRYVAIILIMVGLSSREVSSQSSNIIVNTNAVWEDIEQASQQIESLGGLVRVVRTSGSIVAYVPEFTIPLLERSYSFSPFTVPDVNDTELVTYRDQVANQRCLPDSANLTRLTASTPISERITSSYMIGSCRVDLVLVESSGSTLNWSEAEKENAIEQVTIALNWWAERANEHGSYVQFILNDDPYIATVPDEPIYESSGLYYLWNLDLVDWMEDAFTNIGYSTTNWDGIFDLVNDKRSDSATDWGFCIVLVDNANDGDIVQYDFAG